MNILLVNPSQCDLYGTFTPPDYPPLGLGYLAAVLERQGEQVTIVDVDADRMTETAFGELVAQVRPGLIGITTTTPTYPSALRLAKIAKQRRSSAITVMGGVHVSAIPQEVITEEAVDIIVCGEGEITICEIAAALHQKNPDISNIPGLMYKKGGKIITTEPRQLIRNIDDLPFPARHLFNNLSYTYPDTRFAPAMPIITSRGCTGQCTYCCSHLVFGRRFRYRSAINVVDEIEELITKYGAKEIHLWDDNAALIKRRMHQVADELARRHIKVPMVFVAGVRADFFDDESAQTLREMGVYSIAFGVESGSQRVLDHVKKGITLDQYRAAFKTARKHGFEIWAFFILGLPGENQQTIKETISFAKELDPDIAKFHILVPYPGSEAHAELERKGYILDRNYTHYGIHTRPIHRLETITPGEMVRIQKRAYREFYLRPRIIAKQFARINSFNRAKVNLTAGLAVIKSLVSQ